MADITPTTGVMAVTMTATAEMNARITRKDISKVTKMVNATHATVVPAMAATEITAVMETMGVMAVMGTVPIRRVMSADTAKDMTVTDAATAIAETAASSAGRFLTKLNNKCRFLPGIY